jgi:hypothetical protein
MVALNQMVLIFRSVYQHQTDTISGGETFGGPFLPLWVISRIARALRPGFSGKAAFCWAYLQLQNISQNPDLAIPGQLNIRLYFSRRDLQIAIVIIISGDEFHDR